MKKTLSFAFTHFSVAFMVTWLLTGDLLLGSLVAIIEPLVNTVAYHIHEKIWLQKVRRANHVHAPAHGTDAFAQPA
ncbi:DUF2061 domain-containing protein [Thalassotalea mangrovi]|uniref:DUF2061 domain-containing protein n=1 Tax=Thalassotalea mangrovi TaxID=2572245 RepID=A0A4U1BBV0_9GAMM|nr:DUF2061 domain-containing protein [Thalassotalea mangrovi]TKB47499.1 DUF2061 domain-containing protein [Thalassotalea mangrovi]